MELDRRTTEELAGRLSEALPDASDRIRRWCDRNEHFREMCGDYRQCVEAIGLWKASLSADPAVRIAELEQHLRELQSEILRFLEEHPFSERRDSGEPDA